MLIMKTLLTLSGAMLLFGSVACSQNNGTIHIPDVVMEQFKARFAQAEKVKWEMEGKEEYEANFQLNGEKVSANFRTDGTWTETERRMKVQDLPGTVRESIGKNYGGYKMEEAESVETPDGPRYEVELEKGETTMEVVFDAQGNVLKSTVEEEDEGEENDDDN